MNAELLERAEAALMATLELSRRRDYAGFNKHDGLNSPLLGLLCGWSRPSRLVAIQAVMRSPVDPRSLLGVPATRNPKGIGLFANAYLDLHAARGDDRWLDEGLRLLAWLLENPSTGFRGLSWGYPYPWQDVGFFASRHFPNRVVTCWIGFAFAEAARRTGREEYRRALVRIADFLTGEPRVLFDSPEQKCYTYVPDPSVSWAVMDVPALVGAFLAESGAILERPEMAAEAERLVRWVVDKQTADGAWYYTHPPADSHITHDNYHTAIILECLDRYRGASGDDRFEAASRRGLAFYRDRLFSSGWAPRWMSDREYPHDIHGAASAVLCFTREAVRDPSWWEPAAGVLRWALDTMYDPRGFFYYQQTRWGTKRFLLMRWANAWMCRALAAVLRACASGAPGAPGAPAARGVGGTGTGTTFEESDGDR